MKRLTNSDPDVVVIGSLWGHCPHCFSGQLDVPFQGDLSVNCKARADDPSGFTCRYALLDVFIDDGIQQPIREFRQFINPLETLVLSGVVSFRLRVKAHHHPLVALPQNL